jgi:hypothetical protein
MIQESGGRCKEIRLIMRDFEGYLEECRNIWRKKMEIMRKQEDMIRFVGDTERSDGDNGRSERDSWQIQGDRRGIRLIHESYGRFDGDLKEIPKYSGKTEITRK